MKEDCTSQTRHSESDVHVLYYRIMFDNPMSPCTTLLAEIVTQPAADTITTTGIMYYNFPAGQHSTPFPFDVQSLDGGMILTHTLTLCLPSSKGHFADVSIITFLFSDLSVCCCLVTRMQGKVTT
jgi:hypothetical protein